MIFMYLGSAYKANSFEGFNVVKILTFRVLVAIVLRGSLISVCYHKLFDIRLSIKFVESTETEWFSQTENAANPFYQRHMVHHEMIK